MTEVDIMHEAGRGGAIFWVLREKNRYIVLSLAASGTHSISDSVYERTDDGLSIAIARCNYLAKRATT